LMMWMWLSTIVVLVGAELNSEIEHQTARELDDRARKTARHPRRGHGGHGRRGCDLTAASYPKSPQVRRAETRDREFFEHCLSGALVAVTAERKLCVRLRDARDLMGLAVCLWIVIHLFMLPRAEGYRTWVYLGLVVAPLAWAVAIAIW